MPEHLKTIKAMVSIMNKPALKQNIFNGVPLARKRYKRRLEKKPRQRKEMDLLECIKTDLRILELTDKIIFWDRLNSGKAQVGPTWIKLCRIGTADLVVYGKKKLVIFIECKSPTGKQTPEQIVFMDKMLQAGHRYCLVGSIEEWKSVKEVIERPE